LRLSDEISLVADVAGVNMAKVIRRSTMKELGEDDE